MVLAETAVPEGASMSALGQKQTYAVQNGMSALPPNSDRECGFPQKAMSDLAPKADMRHFIRSTGRRGRAVSAALRDRAPWRS